MIGSMITTETAMKAERESNQKRKKQEREVVNYYCRDIHGEVKFVETRMEECTNITLR